MDGHRPRDRRHQANPHGIPVDARLRAADGLWAIGDVTGIWQLTHVGKYQGEVVASNILGEPREANYEAVPRVVYTDPQAAAVGATEAGSAAPRAHGGGEDRRRTRTPTPRSNGFLTLLSDGKRLTGAYGLGPEAGEWMQQATLAIRARVPLDVLRDTIQPFPTFSEIVAALKALRAEIARAQSRTAPRRRRATSSGAGSAARQTVVVIGGSAGIGLETARLARAEGADVVLTGPRPRAARARRGRGGRAQHGAPSTRPTSTGSSTSSPSCPTPIDHVLVTGPGPYYAPLAEIDLDEARRDVEAHLLLPIEVARYAAGKVRPGGTLLFMGGTGGRRTGARLRVISAATAALPALTGNLALELAPIRVNLIAAGFVDTPLSASLLGDELDARREELRATLPIGRVVGPADVAALAVHLMTNTALTGATYDIDGGQQLV